ncbi:hypothetical protein VNO77_26923 [Canavalia gladiata]|uniref:Uncharacterized protein n=1 Tax=Canavalia gladiata TaxID=3824 RepID=A0AAN9Q3R9_CANGL
MVVLGFNYPNPIKSVQQPVGKFSRLEFSKLKLSLSLYPLSTFDIYFPLCFTLTYSATVIFASNNFSVKIR